MSPLERVTPEGTRPAVLFRRWRGARPAVSRSFGTWPTPIQRI